MKDLIARLEAAEVGNNTLDDSVVIAAHNGQMMDWYDEDAEQYAIQAEDGSRVNVTPVTTSLDAALALAERVVTSARLLDIEGSWEPRDKGVWPAWSVRWYPDGVSHDGKSWHAQIGSGRTPALALCIAILRAKESQA